MDKSLNLEYDGLKKNTLSTEQSMTCKKRLFLMSKLLVAEYKPTEKESKVPTQKNSGKLLTSVTSIILIVASY